MNQILLITCAMSLLLSETSLSQKECDFDDHSFEITLQVIYDVLLESKNDYDSIHYVLNGDLVRVLDENSQMENWFTNDYNYIKEFQGKLRIKSISTDCVNANFKYNVFGKLKTIKFEYPMNTVLHEGTIIKLKFIYNNGKLVDLLEDGNWGSNLDYSIVRFE